MGRPSTGAITTQAARRLELSLLLKNGFLINGCNTEGEIRWTDGSNVSYESHLEGEDKFIRLFYIHTSYVGNQSSHSPVIRLTSVPSNLDKGEILYFVCPVTYERCKILYKCYGSPTWKSRQAYHNRIYYDCQTRSKRMYYNYRYFDVEDQLDALYRKKFKKTYRGKPTRIAKRVARLEQKSQYYDEGRLVGFTQVLQKIISRVK